MNNEKLSKGVQIPPLRKTAVISSADIQAQNIVNQNKDLFGMLEKINVIMWESYMVKDRPFGRKEGSKIMEVLEQWAERH
jgi:hypothetical protein